MYDVGHSIAAEASYLSLRKGYGFLDGQAKRFSLSGITRMRFRGCSPCESERRFLIGDTLSVSNSRADVTIVLL